MFTEQKIKYWKITKIKERIIFSVPNLAFKNNFSHLSIALPQEYLGKHAKVYAQRYHSL